MPKESRRIIELIPSQLVVRKYTGDSGYYVYAGLFDIRGTDIEKYTQFIKLTSKKGLFTYGNAGTQAVSDTGTFDDGNEACDWFFELCKYCRSLASQYDIDVRLVFNKVYMTKPGVTKANANYSLAESVSSAETERIVDSYIWYFTQIAEKFGLKVKSKTRGKHTYKISALNNRFKITGVKADSIN